MLHNTIVNRFFKGDKPTKCDIVKNIKALFLIFFILYNKEVVSWLWISCPKGFVVFGIEGESNTISF